MKKTNNNETVHTQDYDDKISKTETKKLLDIINKSDSLWVLAVNAYNLGRSYTMSKS